MSKTAIVTGVSSGIGHAIALALLHEGWHVIGLSRRKVDIEGHFTSLLIDLRHTHEIEKMLTPYFKNGIDLLVNNAGMGYFAPHEELSIAQIETMVTLNFTVPLLLSRLLLRPLKQSKGWIISIASHSAHVPSRMGCVYASTKAGLIHFSESLFEEVRKSGVKVGTISPDITKTTFFRELSFFPSTNPLSYIEPECVANAVIMMLKQREGSIITEMVIRPQVLQLEKRK